MSLGTRGLKTRLYYFPRKRLVHSNHALIYDFSSKKRRKSLIIDLYNTHTHIHIHIQTHTLELSYVFTTRQVSMLIYHSEIESISSGCHPFSSIYESERNSPNSDGLIHMYF
jgi:hypothetical protein